MANADTLDGAGVNSGNALDAAKVQNKSEITKLSSKKELPPFRMTAHDRLGFTTAGNASLPPYAQVAWFSSASQPVQQEITRQIIELSSGKTYGDEIRIPRHDNSISVAKIRRKSETTKDKEQKKYCHRRVAEHELNRASQQQQPKKSDGNRLRFSL